MLEQEVVILDKLAEKELTTALINQTGKSVAKQINDHESQGLRTFLIKNGIHLTPINEHKKLASLLIWSEEGFPIIAVNQKLSTGRQAWELVAQVNWLISQDLWELPHKNGNSAVLTSNQLLHSRTILNQASDLPINQATIYAFTPAYKLDKPTQNKLAQALSLFFEFNVAPLVKYQQNQI